MPGAIFGSAKWGRTPDTVDPKVYAASLERRIVAVDPAPTSELGADETGIIVEGVRSVRGMQHVSVLADLSCRASPREWANVAIEAYREWNCDALVVELNTGGEMVTTLIDTVARELGVYVNVKPVRAKEKKSKRAEPVSALAETGRIEFVGEFPRLEKQLANFTGINGRRDDRADAFCWGVHDLVFADSFFAV
jgi:phage terminase large subunit-like protein